MGNEDALVEISPVIGACGCFKFFFFPQEGQKLNSRAEDPGT